MACFTVSVFTRVSLARGRRRGGPEDAPLRLQSCTTLFSFSNTPGLRYKQPKVIIHDHSTETGSRTPSELGADCNLQSQNAAFFVKQVDGELNSIGVTEWRTDPRSFTPVRTRAVGKRFIVHLSNRIGGPNLLN